LSTASSAFVRTRGGREDGGGGHGFRARAELLGTEKRNGFRVETLHFLPLVIGIDEIVRTPSLAPASEMKGGAKAQRRCVHRRGGPVREALPTMAMEEVSEILQRG
jgi:hypothetical protein